MTAVFDSPAVDVVPAPDHDGCANTQVAYTATQEPRETAVRSLLEHIVAGILTASSWRELEGWLSETDVAFDLGELNADQVEILARQAIDVSRGVPEQ